MWNNMTAKDKKAVIIGGLSLVIAGISVFGSLQMVNYVSQKDNDLNAVERQYADSLNEVADYKQATKEYNDDIKSGKVKTDIGSGQTEMIQLANSVVDDQKVISKQYLYGAEPEAANPATKAAQKKLADKIGDYSVDGDKSTGLMNKSNVLLNWYVGKKGESVRVGEAIQNSRDDLSVMFNILDKKDKPIGYIKARYDQGTKKFVDFVRYEYDDDKVDR